MYNQKVLLATLGLVFLSGCVLADSYRESYHHKPSAYKVVYAKPQKMLRQETAEAAASADTEIAAAKASAAKIDAVNWAALNKHGFEIGQPLLVKNYGPLTSLYSAVAPKRSFVGTIDAGLYKIYFVLNVSSSFCNSIF